MDAANFLIAAVLGFQAPPPPVRRPDTDPALTHPGLDDRALEQEKRRLNTDPIAPIPSPSPQTTPPSVPPLGDSVLNAKVALPEGTFIANHTGTLIRAKSGDVVFVPLPSADASSPKSPFVIHPGAVLEQLLSASQSTGGPVTLSGQVFQYRARNYVLPTVFSIAPRAAPAPAPEPARPDPVVQPTDPSVTDLLRDLESQRTPPRAMDPVPAADQSAGPERVTEEGQLLVARRARLVRLGGAGGRLAAAFDNDPDSPAGGPMILLPCRALERLEAVAAQQGENVPFKVSGRVYVFEGRNYLLPVLVQAQRIADIAPMQ